MPFIWSPTSKYSSPYDKSKFLLTWNLAILLGVLFGGLTIYHGIINDPNIVPSAGGFLVAIIVLLTLYKTKKFIVAAYIVFVIGTLISQYDMFALVNSQKIVDLVWIFTLALLIFLTLGSRWGIAMLVINMTGMIISVAVVPKEKLIGAIENRDFAGEVDIIINLTVGAFVIAYLIHKILQSARTAEVVSNKYNEQLEEQYEIVQSQNEEKTVMLKEIHHRVKNNLQVITSLLRLQSREISDPKSVEHFEEAMNRVVAMSLIHDKMYQTDDLSKIDLKAYLESLSNDLLASYAVDIPVSINISSELEYIQPKSLVSTALIFNELISNSLKHGFKQQTSGEIKMDIKTPKLDKITFDYSDNGKWKEPSSESSFGLELIETLADQLDGSFTRSVEIGTKYHFTFNYENHQNIK